MLTGLDNAADKDAGFLQILFGLVLAITPRTTKNKNELPATRIHRQCNPRAIEVAFLSVPAIEFFCRGTAPSAAGLVPCLRPRAETTGRDSKG